MIPALQMLVSIGIKSKLSLHLKQILFKAKQRKHIKRENLYV